MGYKKEPVATGGGPATGLAESFIPMLQALWGTPAAAMNSSNPVGQTQGIQGVLSDIFSGGAGNIGGALQAMIQQNTERNVGAVRQRFTQSGGTSRGTPAAYAESTIRAQEGPALASAIGGLQLQALAPILSAITGLAGKGIAQREESMLVQPNPFLSWLQGLGGVAQGAGSLAYGMKARG